MLIYLLIIVILVTFFKKERFTTYLKYKDISGLFDRNYDGETDCIYTEISPQIEKVYNIDFDSPFDRYNVLNINSNYNLSYYEDTSLNIIFDISKQEANNIFPYFQSYRYCDLSSNQLPSCTHLTCGKNEETSEIRIVPRGGRGWRGRGRRGRERINIVSHNKEVADLLDEKRLNAKPKTATELSTKRKNLSNEYDTNVKNSSYYLNSIINDI